MDPSVSAQEPVSPPQEAEVPVESDDAEDAHSPTTADNAAAVKSGHSEPPCRGDKELPLFTASSSYPAKKGQLLDVDKYDADASAGVPAQNQAEQQGQGLEDSLAHGDMEFNDIEQEEVFDTDDDDDDAEATQQHTTGTVRMSSPELLHRLVMHSKTSQTFELRFVMHQRRVTRGEEARRVVQANLQRRLESASSEPAQQAPAATASPSFAAADTESVASTEAEASSSSGSSELAFDIFRELLLSSGEASGVEDNDDTSTHVSINHADDVDVMDGHNSGSSSGGSSRVARIDIASAARRALSDAGSNNSGDNSGEPSDSETSEAAEILGGVHAGSDMIDARAHAQMAEEDRQRRLQDVADMQQQGRVRQMLTGQRRTALEALFGTSSPTTVTAAAAPGGHRGGSSARASSESRGQGGARTRQQREQVEQVERAEAAHNGDNNPELAELHGRGVVSRMLNRRFFITNVNASLATAAHSLGPQRYDVWRQIRRVVRRRRQGTDDGMNQHGAEDAEDAEPRQAAAATANIPQQQRQPTPPMPSPQRAGRQQAHAASHFQQQPRQQQQHPDGATEQVESSRRGPGAGGDGDGASVRPPIAPQRNVRLVDPHIRAPTHRPGARNPEMSGELSQLLTSHLVQNVLHGNFRTVLELHLQNVVTRRRGSSQQQQQQQQRPRRQQPRTRTGIPGQSQPQAHAPARETRAFPPTPPAAAAGPNTAVLARRVDELTRQMADLVTLVQTTYQSQLSMERSLRQEVTAALHGKPPQTQPPSQPATGNHCVICLQAQADTIMYRCGHLCACNACGTKILEEGLPCPCCRAPVADVLRAYTA